MKLVPSRRGGFVLLALVVAVAVASSLLARDEKTPGKEYVNALKMKLVRIEPGKFLMGSPKEEENRSNLEGPRHQVEITKAFYLGVYPVTQEEYEQVLGKNPSYFSSTGDGKDRVKGLKTARFPVETVSWNEAKAFCEALNKKDTKKPADWVYDLPTAAEWEYACRAGTKTAYSFGDDPKKLAEYAWYRDNADSRTHEVGTRKPNPWGLYDLHGNVWQWCADSPRTYKDEHIKDPKFIDKDFHVLRGGSWDYFPRNCRAASRGGNGSGHRNYDVGFRVVLRLPKGLR